ncbi:MAG TPA: PIN domain-containing protein [Candidatus Bilamarchaeaceae archaeon]|nr:PIN domain-containing protein [Candidatus Bilamarchaeaceae archaeon]
MENIFLDSDFIIALVRPADENHIRAKELYQGLPIQNILSDHVLDEVVTYLGGKNEPDIGYEIAKKILSAEHTDVLFSKREEIVEALEIFNKFKTLSLCDALPVILMKRNGIRKILSFDSDLIPGIQRIH